jgi:glycosyltransferase involved in cell wall biosynthesis
MGSLKIIMFARRYWPHGGGVERHIAGLSSELIKMGHRVTVITEQYEPDLKRNETDAGVKIWRIPYSAIQSKMGIWRWMENKKQLLSDADVIHIHDVYWWYWPLRYRLKRKAPHITFHGYEGSNPPRIQAVVQRKLIEWSASGSICVGDFMKKWYLAKPDIVTYGAASVKPTPPPHSRSAVFVGRLDEDTGIKAYLEGMRLIKEPMTLDIYGDGPIIPNTKGLSVASHGWVDKPEKIYAGTRYAFVSRYLSIMEAMQAKRLVVANYNNNIKEDYLRCHPAAKWMLIFKYPSELADLLAKLTQEQEMKMIILAYNWAKKQTYEKLAREYLNLWKK